VYLFVVGQGWNWSQSRHQNFGLIWQLGRKRIFFVSVAQSAVSLWHISSKLDAFLSQMGDLKTLQTLYLRQDKVLDLIVQRKDFGF
jgi:hypothetical protein